MDVNAIAVFIPIAGIIGGISVAIVSIISRMRLRELRIRERIAMIEKGLVPPPEVDPAGFDRAMGYGRGGGYARGRHRRVGITLMGVGFGLMVLITLTGDTVREAIGVGGFLVILGLACLINSLFETRPESVTPPQK